MAPRESLTSLPAHVLARLLAQREISSEELTRAHIDRIERWDGHLRAFTEVFAKKALEAAREADEARAKGQVLGPLMGLPVSVKECFDIEGQATTLGVLARQGHRAPADAALVTMLREQGAVVLGRTNLSQWMLFAESRNPLFGQTANPWSLAHTAGGSSGGEGAAIAAGLSPLGIGTDIGGSIRGPAHVCGIAGLKPGLDRWALRGVVSSLPGQEAVRSVAGPMARTAADIAFFMESMDVRRMAVLDNRVAPVPFGAPRDLDLRGLRVGMLLDDGWLKPSPALARAVHEAADALRRRGCDVVPFVWSGTDEVFELFLAGLTADGGKTLVEGTAGGRLDPVLASLRRIVSLPTQVRATVARLAQALGDATAARVALAVGEKNVATLWKVTQRLRTARMALDDAMAQQGVEALLTPPMATPALPHGLSKEFPVVGAWSMLFNATGFPAGVVPVTRVRSGETERGQEPGRFARRARQVDAASQGLPVGVQVAARPWREDLVVALMMAIEEDVRTQAGFPTTPVDLQSP